MSNLNNRIIKICVIFLFHFLFCSDNDEQYVILVSFDGFRYDYMERMETPNLDYLKQWGVKAESLKPVFPSFTFPNHYSIATGCYADKHRILGNEFQTNMGLYSYKNKSTVQDANWYGAEPIWVTAEKNNIITATYFWVGSEAPIKGYYPTYYKEYKNGIEPKEKVNQVINWLELPVEQRPRLICLYFNEPDHAGHVFGPDSDEVNKKIKESDDILGYLIRSLTKLDIYKRINIVVVSDHGMVFVDENKIINIDNYNIPGIIDGKGPMMSVIDTTLNLNNLHDKEIIGENISNLIIPHVKVVSAFENNDLHYHNSSYDYLLIADEGWMMYNNSHIEEYNGKLPVKGMHGYDSNSMNMHAIFYALGPKFKRNKAIDTFELIHIYPMLCEILGINPYEDIDGDLEVLKDILR